MFHELAQSVGLEPTTLEVETPCSILLSYDCVIGRRYGIRTRNTLILSQLPLPVGLSGAIDYSRTERLIVSGASRPLKIERFTFAELALYLPARSRQDCLIADSSIRSRFFSAASLTSVRSDLCSATCATRARIWLLAS
jgi:hypothetical protein